MLAIYFEMFIVHNTARVLQMLDGWCGVWSPQPPQYIYGSCVEYNKQC